MRFSLWWLALPLLLATVVFETKRRGIPWADSLGWAGCVAALLLFAWRFRIWWKRGPNG